MLDPETRKQYEAAKERIRALMPTLLKEFEL